MSDTAYFIWMIAFVVCANGGIPYLIWMIVTGRKKRWRKLAWMFAIPL